MPLSRMGRFFEKWGAAAIPPVADPTNSLTFPNFDGKPNPLLQTNQIFSVPCEQISPHLPPCAVNRPTAPGQINTVGAINSFIADGLLIGQARSSSTCC